MIAVRPIEEQDLPYILDYWFILSDRNHYLNMGADPDLMPNRAEFEKMLRTQIDQNLKEKNAYCIIWLDQGGIPTGHCNINQIEYGSHAKMHLHLWPQEKRKKGLGLEYVKRSIPYFFKDMKLKRLYCEPYAENIAPNKTLAKIGFTFVKKYRTKPGSINFEQEVNQWVYTKAQLNLLKTGHE